MTVRADLDRHNRHSAWFVTNVAPRLQLRAFTNLHRNRAVSGVSV